MKTIKIGRNPQNNIVLTDNKVSSFHASITEVAGTDGNRFEISDLNSTNGTFVNGQRINHAFITLSDTISVAGVNVNLSSYLDSSKISTSGAIKKSYTVGRSATCDIKIDNSNVSSNHASIIIGTDGSVIVQDNNSTNGTFVNGQKVGKAYLKKGDKLSFSQQYQFDWERHISSKSTKIDGGVAPQPVIKSTKNNKTSLIIGIAASVAIIMALVYFLSTKSFFTDPSQQYKNSVVLIYHSYVLKGGIGNEYMYFTLGAQSLEVYEPGENRPIETTGTGFIVSKDGKIITNRHVALPWEHQNNIEKLSEMLNDYRMSDRNLRNNYSKDDVKVFGESLYLGVAFNDTYVNSKTDLQECILRSESGNADIDVACIQIKSKEIPEKVTHFIDLDNAITNIDKIKPGKEVYMLGYPAGFVVGETKEGLKVNFQSGQITREPDDINIGHNIATIGGASGSPIFDRQGRLIAVNYAGMTQTQGFNFAILAKHAQKLVE